MTGKRRSLTELASSAATRVATPAALAVATPAATERPVAEATPAAEERPVAVATPASPGRAAPGRGHSAGRRSPVPAKRLRFDELERKETRLRADQYETLTTLSRRLNRARAGQGQRITENTLIRVAIDLLLANGNLAGTTEDELRKSVTS